MFTGPLVGRRRLLAASALAACGLSVAARAQPSWPSKPVRLLVGFAPGGPTDVNARLVAAGYGERLGVPFVVDNRAGANGNVAMEAVARSSGDGYTLFFANGQQLVINPHTYPKMPVDPLKDFRSVAMATTGDLVLVIHPSLKVGSLAELIALLRREPNKYSYASTGAGGITHVLMELFKQRTRTEVEAVHYRGSAPAQQDLISGTVELGIDALSAYEQYAREGKVKILAVLSPQRSPLMPEVPTTSEAGVPDFVFVNWFALMAPRSVPDGIVQRLVEANGTVLRDTQAGERLRAAGYTPAPGTSAELSDLIAREFRIFGEVVRANNIRAE